MSYKKLIKPFTLLMLLPVTLIFSSCSTKNQSEDVRFLKSVAKDIPFRINNLHEIGEQAYSFDDTGNKELADYEVKTDGEIIVVRTTFDNLPPTKDADAFWRNLYFNNRQHRIVCVDRFLLKDKPMGLVYVMQMESKRWPKIGTYHWDVTDRRNMYSVIYALDDFRKQTTRTILTGEMPDAQESRKYDEAIRKADSCYFSKNYVESEIFFCMAFEHERCIQGNHLYNAACAAALAGHKDAAFSFLKQRADLEKDWYPNGAMTDKDLESLHSDSRWSAFLEEMNVRRNRGEAKYDTTLRHQLHEIARSDQQIRKEWKTCITLHPEDTLRIDSIFREMAKVDSINLKKISSILDTRGFVGRDKVGEACNAFWTIIQHAPLEYMKKYLPLLKEASRKGDIRKEKVAMTEDRINMYEGKPQKYGSQTTTGPDGRLTVYKLQDPDKVDEYRKAVGMKSLEEYLKDMGATYE